MNYQNRLNENGLEALETEVHLKGVLEGLKKAHVYTQRLNEKSKAQQNKLETLKPRITEMQKKN